MATSAWQKGRRLLRSLWKSAEHRAGPATNPGTPSPSAKPVDELARWKALKADARGMLHPKVYRELYHLARGLPDQDIVEIGGAAGAGSIALALGIRDSGKAARVIVIEKLEGGSRLDIGTRWDNLHLIEQNFSNHGVREQICLFPHELTFENGGGVKALVRNSTLAALVHDADGRVDRDIFLFWNLLRENGSIVIDDYADSPAKFRPVSSRYPSGGIKNVLTFRLTNLMIDWGLIEVVEIVGNTLFGIKPPGASFQPFDLDACQAIITQVERERDARLQRRE